MDMNESLNIVGFYGILTRPYIDVILAVQDVMAVGLHLRGRS